MAHILWRIVGDGAAPTSERWQQGLTLHLCFQSLTTILVRRDHQTRHYLALAGCPACRPDGCDRVCHRALFEQLVRTALPGAALIPVARLAPLADECRHVVAVPHRADSQLLDAAFLAQWPAGRLVTTWSQLQARPQPITVGAQLTVSADGPAPARALRAAGWRVAPLASLISRRARQREVPPPVGIGARASESLFATLRDPRWLLPDPAAAHGEV